MPGQARSRRPAVDFPVPYPVRFTWSGNYRYAYWPVGEQGYITVSHSQLRAPPGRTRSAPRQAYLACRAARPRP